MDFLDSAVDENAVELATEISQKLDEIDNLPNRLKRYAIAKSQSLSMHPFVEKRISSMSESPYREHLEKIAPNLKKCGDYLLFNYYYTVGKVRLVGAEFCKKHLLCQFCAIRRAAKLLELNLARYQLIMAEPENKDLRLSMVTFTVKNGDDFAERYHHIKKSITTLLEHRRKALKGRSGYTSEFRKALGYVGAYETTEKGKGYHVHIHFMVLHREPFHYKTLKAEWQKITGDSHVVNVAAAQHPENHALDFIEVFKYFVKFGGLSENQILDAYEVLRGKHLVVSGGLFRGIKLPENLADEELDNLPYIELVYRYVMGSGYNLTSSERVEPSSTQTELEPAAEQRVTELVDEYIADCKERGFTLSAEVIADFTEFVRQREREDFFSVRNL